MPLHTDPSIAYEIEKLLAYLQNFITLETLEQERVLFFNNAHCQTSAHATAIGMAFLYRKNQLVLELTNA